eukprot:276306-Chlamydomonas_euryale.AAC.1
MVRSRGGTPSEEPHPAHLRNWPKPCLEVHIAAAVQSQAKSFTPSVCWRHGTQRCVHLRCALARPPQGVRDPSWAEAWVIEQVLVVAQRERFADPPVNITGSAVENNKVSNSAYAP